MGPMSSMGSLISMVLVDPLGPIGPKGPSTNSHARKNGLKSYYCGVRSTKNKK